MSDDHLTAARDAISAASGELTSYSWAPSRADIVEAVSLLEVAATHLNTLAEQQFDPTHPPQPGDIVDPCQVAIAPWPPKLLYRVEAVAHGQAWLTASDDGYPLVRPVDELVRVDAVPDSVDTSWHDQHPIDGSTR